ncbi:MAG: ribulose-phosphate 3-epimerase [Chloroflexi bacterium]|nr:ribulose-phosphate 3-epimerase [Chloroflexota bacterium]
MSEMTSPEASPRAAARWPRDGARRVLLAPSIICADWLQIGAEIRLLEEGGADLLHFDVIDGHFAPNLTLGPDLVRAARRISGLPFEAHLMVVEPEPLLGRFAEAGVQLITVHPEVCRDVVQVIRQIRRHGMRAGVALSPTTSPAVLDHILDQIDLVTVMTIVPGLGGQLLIPQMIPKIGDVRRHLGAHAERVLIAVDGQVSRECGPEMVRRGARVLICGTASVFGQGANVRDSLRAFRCDLETRLGVESDEPSTRH